MKQGYDGEKVMVNHDKGGFKGGQEALARLTRGAEPGSLAATPLGAAVELVKEAGTLGELRTRCAELMASR